MSFPGETTVQLAKELVHFKEEDFKASLRQRPVTASSAYVESAHCIVKLFHIFVSSPSCAASQLQYMVGTTFRAS